MIIKFLRTTRYDSHLYTNVFDVTLNSKEYEEDFLINSMLNLYKLKKDSDNEISDYRMTYVPNHIDNKDAAILQYVVYKDKEPFCRKAVLNFDTIIYKTKIDDIKRGLSNWFVNRISADNITLQLYIVSGIKYDNPKNNTII